MSDVQPIVPLSPEELEELRSLAERRLSLEEFEAYVRAPMSPREEADIFDLIGWFTRRYPTPLERLAYVRRAYKRWKAAVEP